MLFGEKYATDIVKQHYCHEQDQINICWLVPTGPEA